MPALTKRDGQITAGTTTSELTTLVFRLVGRRPEDVPAASGCLVYSGNCSWRPGHRLSHRAFVDRGRLRRRHEVAVGFNGRATSVLLPTRERLFEVDLKQPCYQCEVSLDERFYFEYCPVLSGLAQPAHLPLRDSPRHSHRLVPATDRPTDHGAM